jgi:hypothetical protein
MSTETSSEPKGRIRFTSPMGLSATFLIVFSGAVAIAWTSYPASAAAMPLMIGGIGAALSLLQLIIEIVKSRGVYEERVNLHKDLPIYLWVWAFVIAIVAFGFLVAAPIMLFIYLRFRSGEAWWLSLLLAALVWGLLYGVFQNVLGVPLFDGLVTPKILHWLWPASY